MSLIPDSELEYHYSPSRWSHRMSPQDVIEAHVKVMTDATRDSKWCLDVTEDVVYGKGEKQKFDIYTQKDSTQKNSAKKKGCPIFVYFHGGYWQRAEVNLGNAGFMAQSLTAAGATIIPVGYDLCPDVSLEEIVSELKEALNLIFKLAKERHASGIYLCGHSAGAHLAAMMLMSSFQDYDAFDSELIKGAILVSGVYDLRPLVKTSVNKPLKLTEEEAWGLSPLKHIEEMAGLSQGRDVLVAVGEYDPPEFRRQAGELEKSLRDRGVRTRYMDVPDTDHFDVIEKLSRPSYTLTKECLRLMNLPNK